MAEGEYVPVPVQAAKDVAERFKKHVVVIVSWDRDFERLHTTTYGAQAEDKPAAAKLGDLLAKAAYVGRPLPAATTYEDFRERTAASWAKEREELLATIEDLKRKAGG